MQGFRVPKPLERTETVGQRLQTYVLSAIIVLLLCIIVFVSNRPAIVDQAQGLLPLGGPLKDLAGSQ
jgi:hypothetical protein